MHVHVNACITLLRHSTYTSMDGHVNACSWYIKDLIEKKP